MRGDRISLTVSLWDGPGYTNCCGKIQTLWVAPFSRQRVLNYQESRDACSENMLMLLHGSLLLTVCVYNVTDSLQYLSLRFPY